MAELPLRLCRMHSPVGYGGVMPPVLPVRVTAPEAQALATRLADELTVLARGSFDVLAAEIPDLTLDDELSGLTLASCTSTIETGLTMMRHGIPVDRTQPPVAALEHARAMAARGLSIDGTLRFYRLVHAYAWDLWVAALAEEGVHAARLAELLRETGAFMFAYTDRVSSGVSVEWLAERDRRQRRLAVERDRVVAAVLAGEPLDASAATRALGFAVSSPHVGFVCWSQGEVGDLESAAAEYAAAVGTGRPLLVARSDRELFGWQPVDPRRAPVTTPPRQRETRPPVMIAVGSVQSGVAGFRATHEEALRARRLAGITALGPGQIVYFDDVRYLDLLTRDLAAARAFVAAELGGLAAPQERIAALRAFLRVLLSNDGNASATAAALGVHRNTVRQRLARVEELRGRPITVRGAELRAALAIVDAIAGGDGTPLVA